MSATDIGRLAAIAKLGLTDDRHQDLLQELTDQAAAKLNLPISAVSIVLDQAQYFVTQTGIEGWVKEAQGTPVEWSFCVHSVKSKELFIVEDATAHPLFRDNPLVTWGGIGCYLGVPLQTSDGHVLGTLCVIGTEPRTFTPHDIEQVRALAAEAISRLERRSAA